MQIQQDEMNAAQEWAQRLVAGAAAAPPFSFRYGDSPSAALLPTWRLESQSAAAGESLTPHVLTYTDPATGLQVRVEANVHHDFPAVEWVLHLCNTGTTDTPIIGYALWDELLARHPGLIIDNCASGGRRLDLESISRATPLWRTDYAVGHRDPTVAQCHTHGLMYWLPLHGTGGGYLKDWDDYTLRSTMCSALVVGLWGSGDAKQDPIPPDYPFDHARRLLQQYLAVRRFFYGDFYPLTEYTRTADAWMAYELLQTG